jgi:hypothetical protein
VLTPALFYFRPLFLLSLPTPQECFRLLQIRCVEPFGKPAVDLCQYPVSLFRFILLLGDAIQVMLSGSLCYSRPGAEIEEKVAGDNIMAPRETCPQCGSTRDKRDGHIHTGKQNHRCKLCGRAFVLVLENHIITEEQRALIARLLLERISLRGI